MHVDVIYLMGIIISLYSEVLVTTALNISLIIVSIALIASIMLQSKGIGLGGLTGGDSGGVYTQRRGIDKVLFYVTIALSVIFILLALVGVIVK